MGIRFVATVISGLRYFLGLWCVEPEEEEEKDKRKKIQTRDNSLWDLVVEPPPNYPTRVIQWNARALYTHNHIINFTTYLHI